jgi:hypothetical protein
MALILFYGGLEDMVNLGRGGVARNPFIDIIMKVTQEQSRYFVKLFLICIHLFQSIRHFHHFINTN